MLVSTPKNVSAGTLGHTSWFLSETHEVYVSGNNETGQLGLGTTTHQSTPQKFTPPLNKKIISIASGARHGALITDDGKLYTFGHNDKNQLGIATKQDRSAVPLIVQHSARFIAVSCGNNHTLALSSDFKVYSFGSNDSGQLGLPRPTTMISQVNIPETIIGISAGYEHSAALSESGSVYVWGCGTSGQLGLPHSQNVNLAEKLSSVTDKIVNVACGYMHTACVSESGDLYIFGFISNELKFGQSGKKVKSFPLKDPVISLASGSAHILVLLASGVVYGMGVNGHGQLGIDGKAILQVQEIVSLKGNKITQISTGFQHSLALTSNGQVFAFGRNERGQLGVGHSKGQPTPAQVTGIRRIIDIFQLSQDTVLSDTTYFEENVEELPLPPTTYHKDYNLEFQEPIQEETLSLPLPQSFSITGGKKPNY